MGSIIRLVFNGKGVENIETGIWFQHKMGELGKSLLWNWLNFAEETQTQVYFIGKGIVDAQTVFMTLI